MYVLWKKTVSYEDTFVDINLYPAEAIIFIQHLWGVLCTSLVPFSSPKDEYPVLFSKNPYQSSWELVEKYLLLYINL